MYWSFLKKQEHKRFRNFFTGFSVVLLILYILYLEKLLIEN